MNEAFRQVNDLIRSLAPEDPATEAWEFFCECPDVACHALVSLPLVDFDEHRALSPPLPILARHHRESDIEGAAVHAR